MREPKSWVVLDVTFYENEHPPWAEWDCWREWEAIAKPSERISSGTAPSLLAAVDKACASFQEDRP